MEHTKEPWRIEYTRRVYGGGFSVDDDTASISTDAWRSLARVHIEMDGDPSPEGEANARRIVAAVNACEGIPTEALEAGVVAELVRTLTCIDGEARDATPNGDIFLPSEVFELVVTTLARATGSVVMIGGVGDEATPADTGEGK